MKAKSIEEIVEAVAEPEVTYSPEYVTLRNVRVHSTGQEFPKFVPFPYGLEGVNYNDLAANKIIATLADFQKIDFGKCLGCGDG